MCDGGQGRTTVRETDCLQHRLGDNDKERSAWPIRAIPGGGWVPLVFGGGSSHFYGGQETRHAQETVTRPPRKKMAFRAALPGDRLLRKVPAFTTLRKLAVAAVIGSALLAAVVLVASQVT